MTTEPEAEIDINNNDLIKSFKEHFTPEEYELFINQFQLYLQYGDDYNKYVINLDDIYKWLGYKRKEKLKDILIKNFTLNRDYINKIPEEILLPQSGKQDSKHGGHNIDPYYLNIDTLKGLCLLAGTEKGKFVRGYYIKLENLHNINLKKQLEENNTQLQLKDKEIEDLKRQMLKVYEEINTPESIYIHSDTEEGVYKIGFSGNITQRNNASQTYSSTKVEKLFEFKTYNMRLLEKIIHNILHKYKVRNEFYKCNLEYIKNIITIVGNTINTLKSTYESITYEEIIEKLEYNISINQQKICIKDNIVETMVENNEINFNNVILEDFNDKFIITNDIKDRCYKVTITSILSQYKWNDILKILKLQGLTYNRNIKFNDTRGGFIGIKKKDD